MNVIESNRGNRLQSNSNRWQCNTNSNGFPAIDPIRDWRFHLPKWKRSVTRQEIRHNIKTATNEETEEIHHDQGSGSTDKIHHDQENSTTTREICHNGLNLP